MGTGYPPAAPAAAEASGRIQVELKPGSGNFPVARNGGIAGTGRQFWCQRNKPDTFGGGPVWYLERGGELQIDRREGEDYDDIWG